MADAEDVLVSAAAWTTSALRRAWTRRPETHERDPEPSRATLRLDRWLVACFDRSWPIALCDRAARVGWLRRSLGRPVPWQVDPPLVAATDGVRLFVPREAIDCEWVRLAVLALGRRLARGESFHAATDPRDHDVRWVIEAAHGDVALARLLPGLAGSLQRARADALASRPPLARLRNSERAVEELVRSLLRDPVRAVAPLAGPPDPDYRGVAPVAHWGVVRAPDPPTARRDGVERLGDRSPGAVRSSTLTRTPRRRAEPESARRPGPFIVPAAEPHLSLQDPSGLDRPDDRGEEDLDALADELSRLEELATVRSEQTVREVLQASLTPGDVSTPSALRASDEALRYPEWDYRRAAYRDPGVALCEARAAAGDAEWADRVLQRRAPLVALLRRQFLALRPRLDRVPRQIEGDEVDVDGWIVEYGDRVSGRSPSGRHYCLTRRRRRDVAVALLVDASGSTDAWISRDERVIDVAKEAALCLAEALAAVGDRNAIHAFSGQGAGDVRVWVAKRFAEPLDGAARARIGALQPDRSTRLGGAIRHATVSLAAECAQARILLVLSDGKPNDVDLYEGDYGVEDVRQAVAEARAAGVRPFCVTIDRRGPAYLARMFGRSGYAVIWNAAQLPQRFPEIYRNLTRS